MARMGLSVEGLRVQGVGAGTEGSDVITCGLWSQETSVQGISSPGIVIPEDKAPRLTHTRPDVCAPTSPPSHAVHGLRAVHVHGRRSGDRDTCVTRLVCIRGHPCNTSTAQSCVNTAQGPPSVPTPGSRFRVGIQEHGNQSYLSKHTLVSTRV